MKHIKTANPSFSTEKQIDKLLKADTMTILHLQLTEGAILSRHEVNERTLIVVLAGEVEFQFDQQTVHLSPHQLLQMEANEAHTVTAQTNCHFVLIRMHENKSNRSRVLNI